MGWLWRGAAGFLTVSAVLVLLFSVAQSSVPSGSAPLLDESSQRAFVGRDGTPLRLQGGGEEVARLSVLAEVVILEPGAGEGDARVQLSGWAERQSAGGAARVLYTNSSDLMRVAVLADGAAGEVLSEDGEWEEIRLVGMVAPGALVEDLAPLNTRARQVYQQSCATCHAGYAPQLEAIIRGRAPHQWPERRSHALESGVTEANLNLFLRWAQEQSRAHRAGASDAP